MKYQKKNQQTKEKFVLKVRNMKDINKCANAACRLRKAGCRGFEGCPGYMARELE